MNGLDYRKLRQVMKQLVIVVRDQIEHAGLDPNEWPGDEKVRDEVDAFLDNIHDDWPTPDKYAIGMGPNGPRYRAIHVQPELAKLFKLDQAELARYAKEALAQLLHSRKLHEDVAVEGVLKSLDRVTKKAIE